MAQLANFEYMDVIRTQLDQNVRSLPCKKITPLHIDQINNSYCMCMCACVCNAMFSDGNASLGLPVSILPNNTRLPLHVEDGDPT